MSHKNKKLLKKSFWILTYSSIASFLTMITVQYFMGGISDVDRVIGRSLLIGLGLALIVFVVPGSNERYPWQ